MAAYFELLQNGIERLEKAKIKEAKLDAWYLFSECFQITRADYFLRQKEELMEKDDKAKKRWENCLVKKKKREPLQYILGVQEFMGISFFVSPAVLIPRQDTEILVEKALSILKQKDYILDMCTGSGCILLSLMKLGKLFNGVGVDISEEALFIARKNADVLGLKPSFYQSNLFDKIKKGELFDMIISNPPYITEKEMGQLMPEVVEYEPKLALFGGKDGLDFYYKIAKTAKNFLTTKGSLLMEIGCGQAKAVSKILQENGYEEIEVIQDLARLDRVIVGKNGHK